MLCTQEKKIQYAWRNFVRGDTFLWNQRCSRDTHPHGFLVKAFVCFTGDANLIFKVWEADYFIIASFEALVLYTISWVHIV